MPECRLRKHRIDVDPERAVPFLRIDLYLCFRRGAAATSLLRRQEQARAELLASVRAAQDEGETAPDISPPMRSGLKFARQSEMRQSAVSGFRNFALPLTSMMQLPGCSITPVRPAVGHDVFMRGHPPSRASVARGLRGVARGSVRRDLRPFGTGSGWFVTEKEPVRRRLRTEWSVKTTSAGRRCAYRTSREQSLYRTQ
jgi:hypothetical protein